MTKDNPRAAIGGNNPPDPIDEALAPHGDTIDEAQNWLDGEPIENDEQLKATDKLLKALKLALKDVNAARDATTKPLHEVWKAEVARWKPTQEDLDRMIKGIIAAQDPYKKMLAAKKEEERREAWKAAEAAREAAERAAMQANASDIEAQREAAEMAAQAQAAKEAASVKQKDTVKGMRTVHKHQIDDYRSALHWIVKHDRDATTAFIEAYVAKHHRDAQIDGVTSWQEKEAF